MTGQQSATDGLENAGVDASTTVRGAVDGAGERDSSEESVPTVLVVDNYDSFAYNLVQYVGSVLAARGGDAENVVVRRNDAVDLAAVRALDPDAVVVSPGPGTPEDAGVSVPLFEHLERPVLGVCLGHQALCVANGGSVDHADAVVHGKDSPITHDGEGVFAGVADPISVGRYHSLAAAESSLPPVLEPTARTVEEGVLMAVRHTDRPHVGVQFHPESILTDGGRTLVANFLDTVEASA